MAAMEKSAARRGLIIVGIALILVVGLVGIVPRVRENARQEQCVANLQRLAEAIKMYEDDYDAIMPWSGGWGGMCWPVNWLDLMDPYFKQTLRYGWRMTPDEWDALYSCPSAPKAVRTSRPRRTYGYNRYLGKLMHARDPLTVVPPKVKYPETTIRITETVCPHPNAKKGSVESRFEGTFAPVPDWKAAGLSGPLCAPGWHDGKNNVLWVDGHVSTMTKEEVMLTDSNPDPNVWARLAPKPVSAE